MALNILPKTAIEDSSADGAYFRFISRCDDQDVEISEESHTLAKQRDVMLSKLISGEIRMNMRDEENEAIGKNP